MEGPLPCPVFGDMLEKHIGSIVCVAIADTAKRDGHKCCLAYSPPTYVHARLEL